MAKGKKTANIMDVPLSISSVFTPYVGDNGYKHDGAETIYVLSVANGSLANYDETSATAPFGSPSLVVPDEQTLTLAYNKSMLLRIQNSQIQDTPISQFAKTTAIQQCDEVFVPAHDAYSIAKVLAARPSGNKITINLLGTGTIDDATKLKIKFGQTIDKSRTGGADSNQSVAWIAYDFATQLSASINYTGSDAGYADGKKGYLGMYKGVKCVETPDAYLGSGVYVIVADKRSIIAVKPKMDPKGDGMVVLEKVPLFSGIEIQLRDRGDTFVLNKKARTIASLEEAPDA